jgi:hypothetical protein
MALNRTKFQFNRYDSLQLSVLGEQAGLRAAGCLPGSQVSVRSTIELASAMPGHLLAHSGGRSAQTAGDCPDAVACRNATGDFFPLDQTQHPWGAASLSRRDASGNLEHAADR